LILVTLLLTFIGFIVPRIKRPRWMTFLPSLVVLLVLIHLVLEGYRWQMVPAYALTALTFLATVRGIEPSNGIIQWILTYHLIRELLPLKKHGLIVKVTSGLSPSGWGL
jgi:hypothetical protein